MILTDQVIAGQIQSQRVSTWLVGDYLYRLGLSTLGKSCSDYQLPAATQSRKTGSQLARDYPKELYELGGYNVNGIIHRCLETVC